MVYFKGTDQRTTLIERGVMNLQDDEKGARIESFTTTKSGQAGNIVVYLTDLDRYIYFSIPDKGLISAEEMATSSTVLTGTAVTNQ